MPGVRGRINYRYVAFGAILPDIIDKTFGRIIFAHSLANGHLIAHTLIFGCFLALAGFYLYRHTMDARVLTVSGASFLHLVEDRLWTKPATLLWPLLGWKFPGGTAPDNWLDYFLIMFRNSYIPDISYVFISEAVGFIIILLFLFSWMKERS